MRRAWTIAASKTRASTASPPSHLGPDAQAMEDQGIHTDRGDQNRRIKAGNDNMALLKKALAESEKRLTELKRKLAAERMEQIHETVQAADAVWERTEGRSPLPPEPPAPANQPEPPATTPPGRRPTAAERVEQIQKAVHSTDAVPKKEEQPKAPTSEPAPEPPTKQPEPEPPAPPPIPSGPATRRVPPSRYALIDKQNYAARAKNEEEKKKADRERDKDKEKEKEKDERERDPDRER